MHEDVCSPSLSLMHGPSNFAIACEITHFELWIRLEERKLKCNNTDFENLKKYISVYFELKFVVIKIECQTPTKPNIELNAKTWIIQY